MRGVGTSSGAVTIVNALPTGVGCAVAVALPVHAEIELHADPALNSQRIRLERGSDSTLVRETLAVGLSRYGSGGQYSGALRIESIVPVAKGLKSSSAVSGAVLRAVAGAFHQSPGPEEIARLAAEVAQQIGLSATGAFDDCLAAVRGGVALTDNSRRTSLQPAPFDFDLRVVLWIPRGSHAPSTTWSERFRTEISAGQASAEAARAGHWAEAMTLNTELVERVMDYDYGALRSELARNGAVMSGVSGMGPTLAAFVPPPNAASVALHLPSDLGVVKIVELRRAEGVVAGVP
ncbi:MAG: shikimate kinase [Thermoplasmata archaeon]|nr:shikimate kinase [Thermoplasmata archaeon]